MKQRDPLFQLIAVAIVCFSFAFFQTSAVFAADDDTGDDSASPSVGAEGATDGGSEDAGLTSAFQNPAQAAHAANLADAVASVGTDETAEASAAVEAATEGLAEAMASGTPEEIEAAKETLENKEQAFADVVSALTGVISQDINSMRAAGMGWGNIAKELGVHPGVLGLGHTKGIQEAAGATAVGTIETSEVAEATARNTRSGYANGHGLGMNTGVDNETSSLGFGAKGKGVAGASGLGSGQGMAGNNGNHGGDNNSASSGPGNSSNSNRGGAGVAGIDGNPGSGNRGNSNSNGKDKGGQANNGKSSGHGNSQK